MRMIAAFLFLSALDLTALYAAQVRPDMVHLPMFFEPNAGQAGPNVKFIARGLDSNYAFGKNGVALYQGGTRITMDWVGGKSTPEPLGLLPGRSNYFLGQRSDWITEIPNYSRVRYRSIYRGVDLVFYSTAGNLEYDVVLGRGLTSKK